MWFSKLDFSTSVSYFSPCVKGKSGFRQKNGKTAPPPLTSPPGHVTLIMKKNRYLSRLSRAAGWYLPPAEAADVIADYREMLAGDPRSEQELCRDLGKPGQAVRLLVQPRPYRVWLAVFLALSACLLVPGLSPLPGVYPLIYKFCFDWFHYGIVPVLLGLAGGAVWFRWKGQKAERLPRALPVFLAVLLAWCAGVLVFNWAWMHSPEGIWDAWGYMLSFIGPPGRLISRLGAIVGDTLMWGGGLLIPLMGEYGLVRARQEDRRWAAVYALALTAMVLSLETLTLMTNTYFSLADTNLTELRSAFSAYVLLSAAGLAGAGAVLC